MYTHPATLEPKYDQEDGSYIGVPHSRALIEAEADLHLHTEPVEIAPDVFALGEIPRTYPDNLTGVVETEDGPREPDPLIDDQSVAIATPDGTLLLCGCCHAGLRNTIEKAEDVTGQDVRYIIGGTHLKGSDAETVREIAEALAEKIDVIAPTHCTGFEAQQILKETMPDAFELVGSGDRVEI